MKTRTIRTLAGAITAASLAFTGTAAMAAQLEEVVVTAQKRQESMQDVPIAVSAVTGEQFQKTQAFTLEGLSATIPNVQIGHFANTPHNAVFNIRGVGAPIEPDPYAGTTVSIVVDGVPQYFNMMALLDLFDVERVEVLKGPQGTLFGANTTGGVVNVVTKQPTGEYGGEARVTVGEYSRLDGSIALDFPIIEDVLAGKVAVMHHGMDGYYTNVVTGESAGDFDTTGLRTYLRFMGAENFDATLQFEMVESNNGSPAIVNASSPGELQSGEVLGYTRGEVYGDNAKPMYETPCPSITKRCSAPDSYFTANSQVPDQSDFTSYFTILTMNWDIESGNITSITGYKDFRLDEYTDQDFSPVFGSATHRPTDGQQFTQEIRGNFEISDDFVLQAGGFYMDTTYTHVQNYNMNQFAQGLRQLTTNEGDNWSGSLFAQGYYNLTDKLRLQAGIRYTHEETELDVAVDYFMNFIFDDDGNIIGTAPSGWGGDTYLGAAGGSIAASGDDSWDEVGGKLGLDYQVDEDVMIYGFWARGFKSGGFVGRITIPQDIGPYDPEYVDSFEIGVKSELFDRSMRVNAAAFYNMYDDQQIASIYRYTDENGISLNGNSIINAAESEIWGFEVEVDALVTDNLTLNGSLAYLSAEYKDFDYLAPDGNSYDLSGEKLQNAPEWGASASATYELPVGPGTMAATVTYRYQDTKYYTAILNTPRSEIQATHFVDANLDWTPNDDRWTASVWVRNLMDERYISVSYDSPGYAALVGYHPPREAGVSMSYRF